jgi:elongation factor P
MKANDLKPGIAVSIDGQIWQVVNTEHVKPGKGPAFVQAKLKNLMTGSNQEKRLRTSDDLDQAILDRRDVEYLYSEGDGDGVFMDTETYDQTTIPADTLGDALQYCKPNEQILGLFHEGRCVSVELPSSVELEVTDTPPGIKNATATNQLKEATLETGLKTRVPPFINNGETIKVSTSTGEYLSRA